MESSSGNTSFTTNNFTHFGIAKVTEGFVDLNLVHETLFSPVFFHNTCHFVLSLPLEPSLLASFTFFLLYPPAGPPQCYPRGLAPFLFFSLHSLHLLPCLLLPSVPGPTSPLSSGALFPDLCTHRTYNMSQSTLITSSSTSPNLLGVLTWLVTSPPPPF